MRDTFVVLGSIDLVTAFAKPGKGCPDTVRLPLMPLSCGRLAEESRLVWWDLLTCLSPFVLRSFDMSAVTELTRQGISWAGLSALKEIKQPR